VALSTDIDIRIRLSPPFSSPPIFFLSCMAERYYSKYELSFPSICFSSVLTRRTKKISEPVRGRRRRTTHHCYVLQFCVLFWRVIAFNIASLEMVGSFLYAHYHFNLLKSGGDFVLQREENFIAGTPQKRQ